ncbi:MAG: hypothetical protein RLZZ455_519 [Candidatus Parcubacteria bacterium]|jgi:regulatory protein
MEHFEKYYNLALRFLALRPRSEKEVVEYLKKKKVPEETMMQILSRLKEHRFLDDALFAKMWVESRTRGKPRSKWLLTRELTEKGIHNEIIETVFQGNQVVGSDLQMAKNAVGKRIERYRDLPRQEVYQKVGGFLARRGFNWDTSKQAIDDLLKERYNTDE